MTRSQVEYAVAKQITPQMEQVAKAEGVDAEIIRQRMADGQIVIPMNNTHTHRIVGIGQGLSTKINASIGTSTDIADIDAEVRKAVAAQRAGSIGDSFDRAMIQELLINCELAEEGRKLGCQMMVEGPGHVPMDEIEANIILQKRMSNHAPYYMLGPLPTDVGAAYDHVAAAIGAAQSARYGADLVCYITPAEHLALPNEADVIEGVKTARLAAHIGDLTKLPGRTRPRDLTMSKARRDLDWQGQFTHALFSEDAMRIRAERAPTRDSSVCTMCGDFCANKASAEMFKAVLAAGGKA
jgi:phosphomethylpyrimidine synthase